MTKLFDGFFRRAGLPQQLLWGFVGVLIFMMGDGVEQTWLSKYITDQGFNSADLFAVYGVTVAISSWLSGVIAETFGIKRTMLAGFLLYVFGVAGFAGIGMSQMNFQVLMATYADKGLGYPLFAYTFMVWITYRVEQDTLSSAQGWFWFVFTGGLNVLGAYWGIFAFNRFGPQAALWSAIVFAVVGAFFALWLNKAPSDNRFASEVPEGGRLKAFLKGLSILGREPKVLMGGIVRVINTTSQFAFIVFLPLYMFEYGLTQTQWASIWAIIFLFNIVFNLVFGIVGDKIGWNRTVTWFGCIGCAVSVLLFYYSPQIINSYWFILLCGSLWCICLAGFVPLSALVPSLVESDKGAAVSVLNLGAGASAFVGPLLVRLLQKPLGYSGIAWTLAVLYLISAVLMRFIGDKGKK